MKKLCVALLGLMICVSPVLAQKNPVHQKIMGDDLQFSHVVGKWEKLERRLELSDDQIKELNVINRQYKLKYLDKVDEISPVRIKIKRALLEEKVDLQAVRRLMLDAAPIRVDMKILMLEHKAAIKEVLTEDQRLKLERIRHNHQRRGWF